MKILTVANQKGGVGKSTLCCHLAWSAIESGKRVLVVDMDGQMNTTFTLAKKEDKENFSLISSMLYQADLPSKDVFNTESGIDLIPADLATNDLEGLPLDTIMFPTQHLQQFAKDYDICIIDTPPSLGRRLLASLIASDFVFTPLELSEYALQGVESLLETIITVQKKFNSKLKPLGLLPNLFNSRSKSERETLAELKEQLGPMVLPFLMNNRVAVKDAVKAKQPVWRHGKGQSGRKAGQEMKAVVEEVLKRVG